MFSDKIKTLKRLKKEVKKVSWEMMINQVEKGEGLSAKKVQEYTPIICEVYDELSYLIELMENLYAIENIMNGGEK